jgi:uncharacterized protein YyaL (SSP411 family)
MDKNLILRKVQLSDGAEPSGNAIHCENLLRLYNLTHDRSYLEQAEDILMATKRYIDNYSPGYTYHLFNTRRYYDKNAPLVVVALNKEERWREQIRQLLQYHFSPFKGIIWRREGDQKLFERIPFVEQQEPIDGETTLYICRQGVCKEPINDLTKMIAALNEL